MHWMNTLIWIHLHTRTIIANCLLFLFVFVCVWRANEISSVFTVPMIMEIQYFVENLIEIDVYFMPVYLCDQPQVDFIRLNITQQLHLI